MIIRKLRLLRGWSQEQLAQLCGLSVRTIQRLERGQSASLESLTSLAAVFEINVSDLQPEANMEVTTALSTDERQAMEYVRDIKTFYTHLAIFTLLMPALLAINLWVTPSDYLWVLWVLFGWGIGIASHGLMVFEVFNLFGVDWEKKKVEKRLGRKL